MPSIETKPAVSPQLRSATFQATAMINQLCDMVNTYSKQLGLGQKVRKDDWAEIMTGHIEQPYAQLLARNAELVEALERILHPMASEDDIDHAQTVLTRAKS